MPIWESFKEQGGRGVYDKRVSLSSKGTLTLNQPAFDALGKPQRVELFYDRNERLIGVKPSTPEVSYATKVRQQGTNRSWLVNIRPFCYHYDIDLPQTVRFKEIEVSAEGMLILNLNNVSQVVLKRGRRAERALHENRDSNLD